MTQRRVIALSGADGTPFLQDLVTNDVTGDAPVWTALLTAQGKYLVDFFVVPDGDRLLLDVAADLAEGLVQRLSLYRLRRKVDLEITDIEVARGTGAAPDGAFADPRHPDMGWRRFGDQTSDDGTDWDAIRVAHCIPETGIELVPNETYPLEAGFERLNGVDFRKGCYVGQEVTARMKHKTELRKGLATVSVEGRSELGAPITADGKAAGTLYTRSGSRAIAWLRFDRASGDMMAGDARVTREAA